MSPEVVIIIVKFVIMCVEWSGCSGTHSGRIIIDASLEALAELFQRGDGADRAQL